MTVIIKYAYFGDISSSVSNHQNKANIKIKWVNQVLVSYYI